MSDLPYVGDKIVELYQQRQTNLRALCGLTDDVNYQTLFSQITNRRKIPFETVQSLALATGTSLDWFSRTDDLPHEAQDEVSTISESLVGQVFQASKLKTVQDGHPLDLHSLILLYYRNGGLYSALAPYQDQFDAFHLPEKDENGLKLFHMGRNSLATRTLREWNPEKYQATIDRIPANLMMRLRRDYNRASTGEFVTSIETLNDMAEAHGKMVRMDYIRILIRFECEEVGPLIVSHSELLR